MAEVELRKSKYPGSEMRYYDIADAENLFCIGGAYSTPSANLTEGPRTGIHPERETVTIRRGDNPNPPGEWGRRPAYKFHIGGHLVKKDGTPGKRTGAFYFGPDNASLAPAWARELVHEEVTAGDNDWHDIGGVQIRRTKTTSTISSSSQGPRRGAICVMARRFPTSDQRLGVVEWIRCGWRGGPKSQERRRRRHVEGLRPYRPGGLSRVASGVSSAATEVDQARLIRFDRQDLREMRRDPSTARLNAKPANSTETGR